MLYLSLELEHIFFSSFEKHKLRQQNKGRNESPARLGGNRLRAFLLPVDMCAATTGENAEVSQIKRNFKRLLSR